MFDFDFDVSDDNVVFEVNVFFLLKVVSVGKIVSNFGKVDFNVRRREVDVVE